MVPTVAAAEFTWLLCFVLLLGGAWLANKNIVGKDMNTEPVLLWLSPVRLKEMALGLVYKNTNNTYFDNHGQKKYFQPLLPLLGKRQDHPVLGPQSVDTRWTNSSWKGPRTTSMTVPPYLTCWIQWRIFCHLKSNSWGGQKKMDFRVQYIRGLF